MGQSSFGGEYVCKDCYQHIDPVEYAKMKGDLNILLLDYYEKNPEKLDVYWRDHPWVKHLYTPKQLEFDFRYVVRYDTVKVQIGKI